MKKNNGKVMQYQKNMKIDKMMKTNITYNKIFIFLYLMLRLIKKLPSYSYSRFIIENKKIKLKKKDRILAISRFLNATRKQK